MYQTNTFFDKHTILPESEHGFCKGRSPSTALINFLEDVYKTLGDKEACAGLFLDLPKASDLVNHNILL